MKRQSVRSIVVEQSLALNTVLHYIDPYLYCGFYFNDKTSLANAQCENSYNPARFECILPQQGDIFLSLLRFSQWVALFS